MTHPALHGDARHAVESRGSHVQILASAGSGKTEVLAQRIAALIREGTPGSAIVAFTFTERAAAELKSRITARVRGQKTASSAGPDPLADLRVGTIHGYCLELLQRHEAALELHEVIDATRQFAFLTRVGREFGVTAAAGFGTDESLRIADFLRTADVIENELLDPQDLPNALRFAYTDYLAVLDRYRFFTFGQLIVRALKTLDESVSAASYVDMVEHIFVDEYQDINPAQAALISRLARSGAHVCVVGDDDQAIYQWRGSDAGFIRNFRHHYMPLLQFSLTENHRSVPGIVELANSFATTINGRIEKTMLSVRPGSGQSVFTHVADTDTEEAHWIADEIRRLHSSGLAYRDIAVLARSRAAFPRIIEALREANVPARLNGWTALFEHPVAVGLGKAIAWLGGLTWRDDASDEPSTDPSGVAAEICRLFGLSQSHERRLAEHLSSRRTVIEAGDSPIDLVRLVYDLLERIGFSTIDPSEPDAFLMFGAAARFTTLVADYEAVNRRARPAGGSERGQIGGPDRGHWYVRGLGHLILGHAFGTYEGFEGHTRDSIDAVDVGTVHGAKGLEWPVVFVASVTAQRFPSRQVGRLHDWVLPRDLFAAERYEGSDADERRLFYVAMTRARDRLYVSGHAKVNNRRVGASPYLDHVVDVMQQSVNSDPKRTPGDLYGLHKPGVSEALDLTVSCIADFRACPRKYEFRHVLGFSTSIAMELGYGKALHNSIRRVAEAAVGEDADDELVESTIEQDFYLPFANKPAHLKMQNAAKALVKRYFTEHAPKLGPPSAIERPVALNRDSWALAGRVDAIFESERSGLMLVDFKTTVTDEGVPTAEFQLRIYAAALRAEGERVVSALIHDLKASTQFDVDVSEDSVRNALDETDRIAEALSTGRPRATPGIACKACDFRSICSDAAQATKSTRNSPGAPANVRSGSL